jgi:hypothetical protein
MRVIERDAMEPEAKSDKSASMSDFERLAEEKPLSLARELALFITENKKWWLIPIVLVLGALGLLVALSATGAAPFIYTLF